MPSQPRAARWSSAEGMEETMWTSPSQKDADQILPTKAMVEAPSDEEAVEHAVSRLDAAVAGLEQAAKDFAWHVKQAVQNVSLRKKELAESEQAVERAGLERSYSSYLFGDSQLKEGIGEKERAQSRLEVAEQKLCSLEAKAEAAKARIEVVATIAKAKKNTVYCSDGAEITDAVKGG